MIRLLDDSDRRQPRPRPGLLAGMMLTAFVGIISYGLAVRHLAIAPWWTTPIVGGALAFGAARLYTLILERDDR